MAFFTHASALSTSASGVRRAAGPNAPNPTKEHDEGLVRRFNAGDEGAFVEIVGLYRSKMFSAAYALLRNQGDAEEIAQDTFIRAHRGLAAFRGDSSLSTWLHRIAFNLSRNRYWYFRRRHRHDTLSLNAAIRETSEGSVADLIASTEPSPSREATIHEFAAEIAVGMERLSASHREILVMRNVLDLPYDDIARNLGIGVGTVKSRIARARCALRGLLSERYACSVPDALLSAQSLETTWPSGRSLGTGRTSTGS